MRFRILLFFIIASGISTAQELNTIKPDIKALRFLPENENKVMALLSLSVQYQYHDNDTALIMARKALTLSTKIGDKRGETEALFRIGEAYLILNHLEKSLLYLNKSLKKGQPINATYWEARSYRYIASIQHRQTDRPSLNKSIQLVNKALNFFITTKDSSNIAQSYAQISSLWKSEAQLDSALFYIHKAIAINIKRNNFRNLGNNYRYLANLYLTNNNIDEAEYYCKKSIKLQHTYGVQSEFVATYHIFGKISLKQKKYSQAISYLQKAISIARQIKNLRHLPSLYKDLSFVQESLGQHKIALDSYTKFIHLQDSIQYKDEQILLKKQKGELELVQLKNINLALQAQKKEQSSSNKKRKILIIILTIALIIFVLLIINTLRKRKIILQIAKEEKKLANQLIANEIR